METDINVLMLVLKDCSIAVSQCCWR